MSQIRNQTAIINRQLLNIFLLSGLPILSLLSVSKKLLVFQRYASQDFFHESGLVFSHGRQVYLGDRCVRGARPSLPHQAMQGTLHPFSSVHCRLLNHCLFTLLSTSYFKLGFLPTQAGQSRNSAAGHPTSGLVYLSLKSCLLKMRSSTSMSHLQISLNNSFPACWTFHLSELSFVFLIYTAFQSNQFINL